MFQEMFRRISDKMAPPASPKLANFLEQVREKGVPEFSIPHRPTYIFDIYGPDRARIRFPWGKSTLGFLEKSFFVKIDPQRQIKVKNEGFVRSDGRDWPPT